MGRPGNRGDCGCRGLGRGQIAAVYGQFSSRVEWLLGQASSR